MFLFGKTADAPRKAVQTTASPIEAIGKIKRTVEVLHKRVAHLETKRDAELRKAKEHMKRGNRGKRQALMCLKRKRMFDKELDATMLQALNLEKHAIILEGATTGKLVFDATVQATNQLKHLHQDMGIEAVADARDDLAEALDVNDELRELLSAPIDNADDDELLEELEELQEAQAETLLEAAAAPAAPAAATPAMLPAAPTGSLSVAAAAIGVDAEELAELEALMTA